MRKKYSLLVAFVFLALLVPAVYAADNNVQDASYWRKEGDKHLVGQKYDDAIECYKKSFAIDPLYARTAYRIAYIYDVQKTFGESPPYLDKAGRDLRRHPGNNGTLSTVRFSGSRMAEKRKDIGYR